MNAGLRFAVITLAFFGALSQSSAAPKAAAAKAATSIMICDQSENSGLCLIEPLEAPEQVILRDESTKAPSMVSDVEKSGGSVSVENEALLELAMNPIDMNLRPATALANAQRANDKVRAVEMYLQTASPSGDLTVISAGKKEK